MSKISDSIRAATEHAPHLAAAARRAGGVMQSIADGIDFFSAAAPPVMDAVRAVQEGRVSVAFRGGRVRVTVSPEAR